MRKLILLALTVCSVVLSAARPAPAADFKPVAPFVDETAYAVLAVNLETLDLAAMEKLIADAARASDLPAAEQEQLMEHLRQQVFMGLQRQRDALLRAGAKRVYLVASLAHLPDDPVFGVIPIEPGADEAAIRNLGPGADPAQPANIDAGEIIGGQLVVAKPATLRRLKEGPPAPRPELQQALESNVQSPLVLALAPGEQTRQVFGEMLPQLPPELGGGSIKPITQGLRWATLSVQFVPETAVRLDVAARDPSAAEALLRSLQGVLQSPAVGNVRIEAQVEGDRIRAALHRQALAPLVAALGQVQLKALGMQSATHLRQLGQAMMVYANEHKGRFPATLEEAAASQDLNRAVLTNPRFPRRQPGYVYVRPEPADEKSDPPPDAVLAYESYDAWPTGGVWVLFGDGHAELIDDEARLHKALEATRAPQQRARDAGAK